MVEITYFVPDTKKDGGAYITCSGCVKKIDKYKHTVVMTDQTIIPIEQIRYMRGKCLKNSNGADSIKKSGTIAVS